MRLDCEIVAVSADGEQLTVRLQGNSKRDADWRRMGVHTFEIVETAKTQRAFHLGRRIIIDVRLA